MLTNCLSTETAIFIGKLMLVKKVRKGCKAGSLAYQGRYQAPYIRIYYNKQFYLLSRLIFLMFYGYLPECVTFKDKNTLNTRIENLLEANKSEITYRRRIPSHNKTGVKGVYFNKKSNKYVAQITKNQRVIYIGRYNKKEDAERFYLEEKEKYHGEFLNKCKSETLK